ncbi:hypothetical protein PQR62_12325 [Herbaspirillum lusitanum]|uniref:Uncharacterized protein n=1 Tax=Herbaspirillum lusitanum TaxID=213312 RepID=A0ABW9AAZ8_9BURK
MLREFAFSPDVFFPEAFGVKGANGEFIAAENHGHVALVVLWKGIERFGVIRDLADGNWGRTLENRREGLHIRSRELLKKLLRDGRIVKTVASGVSPPVAEMGWLLEALASHAADPEISQFFGTDDFCGPLKAADYQHLPKGISKIPFCSPFSGDGCSIKVDRNVAAYISTLRPLIKYSRSLMFIDPYLDLQSANYKDFLILLREIAAVNPGIDIELHRQIKPTQGEKLLSASEWKNRLHDAVAIDPVLKILKIKVFIWDEFHDRYLISNLMGISVPYGFDTTKKGDATRWSMLSPSDTDDVRQEFTEGDPQRRRKIQIT